MKSKHLSNMIVCVHGLLYIRADSVRVAPYRV